MSRVEGLRRFERIDRKAHPRNDDHWQRQRRRPTQLEIPRFSSQELDHGVQHLRRLYSRSPLRVCPSLLVRASKVPPML